MENSPIDQTLTNGGARTSDSSPPDQVDAGEPGAALAMSADMAAFRRVLSELQSVREELETALSKAFTIASSMVYDIQHQASDDALERLAPEATELLDLVEGAIELDATHCDGSRAEES